MVAKQDIYRRYRECGFWTRSYLRIKLKICPLIALETHFPPRGKIVDLGCGNGLFAHILNLGAPRREILGFDLDADKIRTAGQTIVEGMQAHFHPGNITEMSIPAADVISLVDVLYLIPYDLQESLLNRCHAALKPGGRLIIKEMDSRPRWKAAWNRIQETLAVKIFGFTLGGRFYFRSREGYHALLSRSGLQVRSHPLHRGYWYPHIVHIATKQ